MKQKIELPTVFHTVNVIQINDSGIRVIRSFADTPEGNKQARKFFCHMIRKYEKNHNLIPSDKRELKGYIEEGFYDIYEFNGIKQEYKLLLIHSD